MRPGASTGPCKGSPPAGLRALTPWPSITASSVVFGMTSGGCALHELEFEGCVDHSISSLARSRHFRACLSLGFPNRGHCQSEEPFEFKRSPAIMERTHHQIPLAVPSPSDSARSASQQERACRAGGIGEATKPSGLRRRASWTWTTRSKPHTRVPRRAGPASRFLPGPLAV